MAKTLAQIATEITNKILTGGRRTTATNTRSVLTDISQSSLNLKDGGMVIESKVGYSTPITPTEDYEFATKKFVLDNAGVTPDATTTIKGKSELIEDAELDNATPSDNSATTPTESAITLGIRQLYRLWKKIFTVFYTKVEADAKYIDKYSLMLEVDATNGGSGNAFTVTDARFSGDIPRIFILKFPVGIGLQPSGASTLAFNGIGPFPLYAEDGTDLAAGQIGNGIGFNFICVLGNDNVVGDCFYLQGIRASGGGGSGDVVGPASATDNALARFDTTTGKLLQNSTASLDDSGNLITSDITVSNATVSTPTFFDASKKLISATGALLGSFWHTLTSKSTPINADEIIVLDSASSFEAKRTTLTQLWTDYLKPKTDATYWIQGGNILSADTVIGGTSGAFALDFRTNNLTAFKVLSSPTSATNYLTIQSATTANPAILSADGSTNVGIIFQAKGAESIYFKNTGAGNSLKLKWYDSNGGTYRDVISEVGASNAVGIATGFTTVNTASNFNLGNNAVFRSANNVLKIVGSSSTSSSVGVVFGTNSANFGSFIPTTGTHYLINMWSEANNSFAPTTGNANMRMIDLSAFSIHQTGASGNVSLINLAPTVTSVSGSLYAIKSSIESGTNRYNLYIDGTASNYLNGNTSIKTTTATAFLTLGGSTTSNASLRILAGSAPFSPNDGDVWYDGTNIYIIVSGTTKTFTIV